MKLRPYTHRTSGYTRAGVRVRLFARVGRWFVHAEIGRRALGVYASGGARDASSIRRYEFKRHRAENSWDCIRRLAEEVGATLVYEDAAIDALRDQTGERSVERSQMTRTQFVSELIAEAGVPGRVTFVLGS